MDPDEIDRTVAAVLGGKRELYQAVIEACESAVRLTLAALLPDNDAVEDLAQETFVIAFAKLREYRPGSDFKAWIRAVARNLAFNERRRWVRKQSLLRRYRARIEEAVAPRLETLTADLGDDASVALRHCVSQLQDHARGVVEAFYFDDLPSGKIAERFRRPASWVFVVLHRARVAIGQCLKSKGVLPDEA
jgi:RNA polymerase sigma-70 factor (ECF subfamily)